MRLLWLTLLSGLAFLLIDVMLIELIKDKDAPWTRAHFICTLSSPIAGIFITRIILLAILKQREK